LSSNTGEEGGGDDDDIREARPCICTNPYQPKVQVTGFLVRNDKLRRLDEMMLYADCLMIEVPTNVVPMYQCDVTLSWRRQIGRRHEMLRLVSGIIEQ